MRTGFSTTWHNDPLQAGGQEYDRIRTLPNAPVPDDGRVAR
jgi:hypothetical protein